MNRPRPPRTDLEAPLDHAESRRRLVGIALMCTALVCFSALDATAKYLNQVLDPLQTVWVRYIGSVVLVSLFVNAFTTPGVSRTARPWLQGARSLLLFGSTVFNFLALQYLQLAEAMAITFSVPFLVALLAGPMLGERLGPRRVAAIAIGFLGVLVVVRPGLGGLHPAFLLSLMGVVCYGLYAITTRMLAQVDHPRTILFYSGLGGVALATPIVPFVWIEPPSLAFWLLLGSVAVYGTVGHWLLILAHARAPAAVLSPFLYTQIVWMLALGWLVFGDFPDVFTLIGAAIVIACGLYLLARERAIRGRRP